MADDTAQKPGLRVPVMGNGAIGPFPTVFVTLDSVSLIYKNDSTALHLRCVFESFLEW